MEPTKESVSGSLERILSSDTFARSDRARKLLSYIVEQQQAGQADRLKGVSIAMDVFGKDAGHDPSTDAHVRVQAGRLRELLDQYYASEGQKERLRIVVPRGSYVPSFEVNQAPAAITAGADLPIAHALAAGAEAGSPKRRSGYLMRQLRLFWMAFGVVFALLGFLTYNSWKDNRGTMTIAANAAQASRVAEAAISLPHVFLTVAEDPAATKFGNVLRIALTGIDPVVYVARDAPKEGDAAALDFNFELTPGPAEGSVTATLQHLRSGEVVASRTFAAADLAPDVIDDRIADLVTSTLPVSGVLYAYLESRGLQRGLTRCLLLDDDYYLAQSSPAHKAAYECYEQLLKSGASSPLIFAGLAALQMEAVSDKYAYPPDASMDNALSLARQAVQMAPTSPYAHRAYGFVYTRMGVENESLKWMKKAYELGRYDLNMAAAYGYGLTMAGQFEEGAAVMQRAVDATSARPSWWDYTLFLGDYMLGKDKDAADATDALTTAKRPHYLAARLIAARTRGNDRLAEDLKAELITGHKDFVADPLGYFERADYPATLSQKLFDGLRAAGLGTQS